MKTRTLLIVLTATAGLCTGVPVFAIDKAGGKGQRTLEGSSSEKPRFVPGEVIVKMKPTRSLDAPAAAGLGVEEVVQQTSGGEKVYRIPSSTRSTMSDKQVTDRTLSAVQEFRARDDVEYAQPNWIKRIVATPNDERFHDQWHYRNNGAGTGLSAGGIGLPSAWDQTKGSHDVVVAVVDTGILPDHPDITGSPNLLRGHDMITDPKIANDGGGRDNDPSDPGDAVGADECSPGDPASPSSWHGTHVAGTIGAGRTNNGIGVAGINWNTKVIVVRVLGKCGGTTVDINDGIRWAAGLDVLGVPKNMNPARVINMSLGTPPGVSCDDDPATQSAIRDAVEAGALVVVAAGNDAVDASQVSPASCDNAFTVAASDARGQLVSRYSNFGPLVKIMAPGGDRQRDDNGDGQPDGVLSMVKDGYAYYNGTSMAAPHVAGVAALIISQNPEMIPGQIMARLQHDALPRDAAQCPNPCGAGLLQAKFVDPLLVDGEVIPLQIIPPAPPATLGTIQKPGEKDLYEFQVAMEKRYLIETQGGTDLYMTLFGPNSPTAKVAEDDDSGEASNPKIVQALKPGAYRVEVRHYSPTGIGDYRIWVRQDEP
ncbi:S8 family serine peptidase [Nitrospira sp. Nam80]